jgi:hypothetical protein
VFPGRLTVVTGRAEAVRVATGRSGPRRVHLVWFLRRDSHGTPRHLLSEIARVICDDSGLSRENTHPRAGRLPHVISDGGIAIMGTVRRLIAPLRASPEPADQEVDFRRYVPVRTPPPRRSQTRPRPAVPVMPLHSCGYGEKQRSAVTATAWQPLSPGVAGLQVCVPETPVSGTSRAREVDHARVCAGRWLVV